MLDVLTTTPEYQDWQWQLAQHLRSAIEDVYAERGGEVACVAAMVGAMQKTRTIHCRAARGMHANVEGAFLDVDGEFLHGHRSQVKFSIGGEEHQRELADLLVLASHVEGNRLRWQRACFVQAKRASAGAGKKQGRFEINKWQLALLHGFPAFHGVSGVFKDGDFHLRNRSGMLGAYGLLTAPGGFSLVSARIIKQVLSGRESLTSKDLVAAFVSEASSLRATTPVYPWPWWPLDPEHCPECREIVECCLPFPWRHHHHHHRGPHSDVAVHGNESPNSVLSCIGLDEFVQAWSGLRLGEKWRTGVGVTSDRTLHGAIAGLISRVASGTGQLHQLQGLLLEGFDNEPPEPPWRDDVEEAPSPGGGLGVLSLVVTSGPGE